MKCKTCKLWDNEHPRIRHAPQIDGIDDPGFCRKHKPGAYMVKNDKGDSFAIGIQPIMDANEYCGEHREKE